MPQPASCSSLLTSIAHSRRSIAPRHVRYQSSQPFPSKASQTPLWTIKRQRPPRGKALEADGPSLSEMKTITRTLADRQGTVRNNWDHTPTLRGEEMRLKNALRLAGQGQGNRQMSKEKQEFFADGNDSIAEEDSSVASLSLGPGSFIETRRNDKATMGIVLGSSFIQARQFIVTMAESGEIWEHRPADVTFIIPSFVSVNLAERCGLDHTPSSDVQLHARMEVLKRLRELIRALEEKYNHMWHSKVDIYSMVKSHDLTLWSETSVAEVACMLEKNPKYLAIYATHRFLMNHSLHFVARDPYILAQTFGVRPQQEVEEIEKILNWKRLKDGPLQSFAKRARPIIAANEKRLKESAGEGPTQVPVPDIWNEDDKVIISFLLDSLRPYRSNQADPFTVGQSAIMRLLDPLAPEIEDHHVHWMLVKLGVISPWQDLVVLQKNLGIEPEENSESPLAKAQNDLVRRSLSSKPPAKGPLGPEDFYPSDPLESVRHDFGQLPVFVIDDASAKELDDGISVERIPSEPGCFWVHTHVANPSAVLPPTHVLAQQALKQGTTQYLLHRSIPLFPNSLIHDPDSGWSLGATAKKGLPSRVMTFSAKVDEAGNLLDYKVRAGLVSNVRVVSYDAVNEVLGFDDPNLIQYPFGQNEAAQPKAAGGPFAESELEDLRLLFKISQNLRQRRINDGVMSFCWYSSTVKFGSFPPGTMTPSLKLRQFQGFPEFVQYSVQPSDYGEQGSWGLVAEAMKLASRVASRFAQDHRLPLIRRAAEPAVFVSEKDEEAALKLRRPSGLAFLPDIVQHLALIPGAEYSLEPKQHAFLGVAEGEGYSRVTSPLRRVLDLVSHWQFHTALLGSKAPTSAPMFGEEWMENFKNSFSIVERLRSKASENQEQFWRLMFVRKWLDGQLSGLGPGPAKVFEARVLDSPRRHVGTADTSHTIIIPALGLQGRLEVSEPEIPGAKVAVKVAHIRLGVRPQITFVKA